VVDEDSYDLEEQLLIKARE
jgi:hypothetical protein